MQLLNESMGKITNVLYKQIKENGKLEIELTKSKEMQRGMKLEVIQLKEMINDFVKNHCKEIEEKDKEIEFLKSSKKIQEI